MRSPVVGASLLVAVCLLPLTPADAQVVHAVEVTDFEYVPSRVLASAGDDVLWTWTKGSHDIVAYTGAGFDSGPEQTEGTFSTTFEGGTALYRCRPHSWLTEDNPPRCIGMCGIITDSPPVLDPPTITQPRQDSDVSPEVTIAGSSSVGIEVDRVEVWEEDQLLNWTTPSNGSWWIVMYVEPGEHTIRAVAVAGDEVSEQSASVTFTVDATPPDARITTPGTPVAAGVNAVAFGGEAHDDRAVAGVELLARTPASGTYRITVECTGCGGSSATWTAMASLPTGVYQVVATARDAARNTRESEPVTLVIA